MTQERALIGWKAIAQMFGVTDRTMKRELSEAGAIFYMRHGRPPQIRVCAFPSLLKAWTVLKTSRGEVI